ncbi:MAG TPA: UDP-glucose 4-epimerase GalE, partial [Actinobacteria bacterium]|nr:UDP-glucose 4-epimerase GalE [Actinomycetota bacterium]
MTRWLLTGGAGYIGSHVATELLASGRGVVVVDDLSTGYVARIPAGTTFVEGSVQDADLLTRVMQQSDIDGVVHLAAKKAVGESVERPLHYYRENVDGVLCVLTAMNAAGVDKIVYSSSAAAYGEPAVGEVSETEP